LFKYNLFLFFRFFYRYDVIFTNKFCFRLSRNINILTNINVSGHSFNKIISQKQLFFMNQKIYIFKFMSKLTKSTILSKYFTCLYYISNHNVNFNTFNLLNSIKDRTKRFYNYWFKANYKKKIIYKIKNARTFFIKYFFAATSMIRLTKRIIQYKNYPMVYFIYAQTAYVYSFLINLKMCYNFLSFKFVLLNRLVWLNEKVVTNQFQTFENTDIIKIAMFGEYFDFLKSMYFYNFSFIKHCLFNSNHEKKHLFKRYNRYINYSINLNLEKSFLTMTFIYLNMYKISPNMSSFNKFNLANIRTYNWLIVT